MTFRAAVAGESPLIVLCGVDQRRGNRLPRRGEAVATDWTADPDGAGGFTGLPFGKGDPAAAYLDASTWAVVRVQDIANATPVLGEEGDPAAIRFRGGTVLFLGAPRGALEAMLLLGVDPRGMATGLVLPDEAGLAEAGIYGFAVAGCGGVARAGAHGRALAETGGIAVAGTRGIAIVEGSYGLAVAGSAGQAEVGCDGVAVARGVAACAVAGEHGVAVAMAGAGRAIAGVNGRALALGPGKFLKVGDDGIAVAMEARPGGTRVVLGERAVCILRWRDPAVGAARFYLAITGEGGVRPGVKYIFEDNALHVYSSDRHSMLGVADGEPAMPVDPDFGDCVIVADESEAIAGDEGLAVAEAGGSASAGLRGIAVGSSPGLVRAGAFGVAVSEGKRFGEARAAGGGVAIGRGRFKMVQAGAGGAALVMEYGGTVKAGDDGLALGAADLASVGCNGVAVALAGAVSGDHGSLLVIRWLDPGQDSPRVAYGIVGEHGLMPLRRYVAYGKGLCPEDDVPPISGGID
ncbi:MAG: hypothetical protein K2Z25_25765 [Beijerinckiaceae bacterium]|nr:hypothetical protein [Beijerinckiaceae bacterium]